MTNSIQKEKTFRIKSMVNFNPKKTPILIAKSISIVLMLVFIPLFIIWLLMVAVFSTDSPYYTVKGFATVGVFSGLMVDIIAFLCIKSNFQSGFVLMMLLSSAIVFIVGGYCWSTPPKHSHTGVMIYPIILLLAEWWTLKKYFH